MYPFFIFKIDKIWMKDVISIELSFKLSKSPLTEIVKFYCPEQLTYTSMLCYNVLPELLDHVVKYFQKWLKRA